MHSSSVGIQEEKKGNRLIRKIRFLKSEKISRKMRKNAAAYATERPLFLDSFLKPKIRGL